MINDTHTKRVALAEEFFESATLLTEIAVRNSLSRLYYANYHLALLLTKEANHSKIAHRLQAEFGSIGGAYGKLHDLRSQMDYRPEFAGARGSVDLRSWFADQLNESIDLYYQLRGLVGRMEGVNDDSSTGE